jgi:predicted O-methyltransferase YrrM
MLAQHAALRIGGLVVPTLQSGMRRTLPAQGDPGAIDVSIPLATHPLAHLTTDVRHTFVHLEGQSNHQDAAFAIFTARAFLREFFPEAVAALIPTEHRGTFGSTAFERTVTRTTTGRSLGSPYMTHCEQAALGVLVRHACGLGTGAAPIIEIGSAIGGSTLLMAAATEGDTPSDGPIIHSIDPDIATRPAMRALLEFSGHAPRLRQIVKTSDVAAAELFHLSGTVGFVFVDGLHTRECSLSDFNFYAPLIRRGGLIAFHDCDIRHAGVFATVSEIASRDSGFSLRLLVDTIAVFERTSE